MVLLHEFVRVAAERKTGRAIERAAVRGLIADQGKLLLIYSAKHGDYKIPGGGVEPGETHAQALARELSEECGARLLAVEGEFGHVIEYNPPIETEFDVFRMTSYYYHCAIAPDLHATCLDDYERDLGFRPVWIDPRAAVASNARLIQAGAAPRWAERDTFVLTAALPLFLD